MDVPQRVVVDVPAEGHLEVVLAVPGYEGTVEFTIGCEMDNDGDYRVFIPWFKDEEGIRDRDLTLENGVEVTNGIAYVGADDQ